jgi:hypothetical protein
VRPLAAVLTALALGAPVAACGDDSGDDGGTAGPGGAAAIAAAEAYVTARGAAARDESQFLRSTRDAEWALVTGGAGRRIWAVWLRAEDGRWQPEHALLNGRGNDRPAAVPCDIKPPFAEPECAPQP